MKIILSKAQWEMIGKKAGWTKEARRFYSEEDFEKMIASGDLKMIKETPSSTVYKDEYENTIVTATYVLSYNYKNDPGAGYSFPCDKNGKILFDEMGGGSKNSLKFVKSNLDKFLAPVKEIRTDIESLCNCGSGLPREAKYDARGII